MKPTIGWAIKMRDGGLYIGWHRTRIGMIAEHASDKRYVTEPEVSRFAHGRSLLPEQRAIWKRCVKDGDRAVKVSIRIVS